MTAIYLRIGRWDDSERSRNFATGEFEAGVSVYDLDPAGAPIDPGEGEWSADDLRDRLAGDDPKFLVTGDVVGEGGDGEPLLRNVRVIGHWQEGGAPDRAKGRDRQPRTVTGAPRRSYQEQGRHGPKTKRLQARSPHLTAETN